MQNVNNQTEVIKHQVYSLDAVFKTIEPYLKEGFSFDFSTNEGYPVQIGTVYSFHVIKRQLGVTSTEIPVEQTENSNDSEPEVQTNTTTSEKPKTRRALAASTKSTTESN